MRDVVQEASATAEEICASFVEALLEHGGVRPREVRRRQCVEHVGRGEPRLPLGPPVEVGIGDQAVDGVTGGEVGLHDAMKQPVVLPRPIAEPAIALGGSSIGAPGRHAGELHAKAGCVARGTARMARPSGDGPAGGPRLEEPAQATVFEHGVGEHHVEP